MPDNSITTLLTMLCREDINKLSALSAAVNANAFNILKCRKLTAAGLLVLGIGAYFTGKKVNRLESRVSKLEELLKNAEVRTEEETEEE